MRIEDLQKKVEAAELKVEKCRKTIDRHTAQMEKKGKQLRDLGIDPDTADKYVYAQQNNHDVYWLLCDYEQKQDDIKGATKKLADAERICSGWHEKLDLEINRDKVIQEQVPEVIKTFLQDWKDKSFEWYVKRYATFLEVKQNLRQKALDARKEAFLTLPEYADKRERYAERMREPGFLDESFLINLYPYKPVENFLRDRDLDSKSIQKKLSYVGDGIIYKMCDFRNKAERLAWLDKTLEEDKKDKMLSLVENVTKYTGPITDASRLSIYGGELNGVILGEKGAAKVNTFSAGGWNIQCFHFRTTVQDVSHQFQKKASLDSMIASAAKVSEAQESKSRTKEKESNKDR